MAHGAAAAAGALKLVYTPGVTAPGMSVPVEVEVASAEPLEISEVVIVITEREEISLPISATILGASRPVHMRAPAWQHYGSTRRLAVLRAADTAHLLPTTHHPLIHSLTHPLTHSPTHPLTHSPTHSPTHPLTHPLTHSPTHLLSYSPTIPLTHNSPSPSLTYQGDEAYGEYIAASASRKGPLAPRVISTSLRPEGLHKVRAPSVGDASAGAPRGLAPKTRGRRPDFFAEPKSDGEPESEEEPEPEAGDG